MASDDVVKSQALDWAVRAGDPAFAGWDEFMLWLESDPAHAEAYDEVSAAVADGAGLIATSGPANDQVAFETEAPDDRVPSPRRRPWLAGGIAAMLAVVAGTWVFESGRSDLYTVQTAPGETRVITLEEGTRVELAGGSAAVFDRRNLRYASLEGGQALFTVRHDPSDPFEVHVGDERLVDLGTVFDVRREKGGMSVAVSEGSVQFDPDGAAVRIAPGQILRHRAGSSDYSIGQIPAEQIGEWRDGRLTFSSASLTEIAAELTRATGVAYEARGAGTVSGSIVVSSLRKDPEAIGPLLGLSVHSEGKRWVIGRR